MRVLVIEDNPVVRRGIERALEHHRFSVTGCGDALAGFAALEQGVYDAIVCDIGLPFVDGIAFYRQLVEAHPSLSNRVLFVTAMANDPVVDAFLSAAGRPVLSKPFELEDLVSAIQQVATSNPSEDLQPGLGQADRLAARRLPDELLELSGTPIERIAQLVQGHWRVASETEQRQLEQMLMVVLDPVLRGGPISASLRLECEQAVMGWLARR